MITIMKKIFSIFVALFLLGGTIRAQHEVGIIAGGLNGLTYKYWIGEYMALQTDVGIGLYKAVGATYMKSPNSASSSSGSGSDTYDVYDFTFNPNFAGYIPIWDDLAFYAGCGTSIGFVSEMDNTDSDYFLGKWGVNALTGIEYAIAEFPLSIALDFRPGFSLAWQKRGSYTQHVTMFDWKLAIAVRYRI